MKISALPKDADALVTFAESIATALAEKQEQLGIATEVEAPLRAAIAGATSAGDAYVAALAHPEKSPAAEHRRYKWGAASIAAPFGGFRDVV
jgi:hypothetical protein